MHIKNSAEKIAIMGWNLQIIEAADKLKKPFVVVSLSTFQDYADKHGIPFVAWDFPKNLTYNEIYLQSESLYQKLKELNVNIAVPVLEETVEWSGAVNSYLKEDVDFFTQSLLFRDKGRMKRKALLGGLRVGVFEEAKTKDDITNFFKRVSEVSFKKSNRKIHPVHIKPFNLAGAAGHRIAHAEEDIEKISEQIKFPCLMETHLDGIEFSCEVFVFNKKIMFLNITEYVKLGYSSLVPPSPWLEEHRESIRKAVNQLIDAFEIEYGFIHPEFFVSDDGIFYFGEVAYRIPGGHIFDLIQKTYNFSPYEAYVLCNDPSESEDRIKNIFTDEKKTNGHAGSLMVYPRVKCIKDVNIPTELQELSCFDKHTLFEKIETKINVDDNEGYGNHYGTVFFHGKNSEEIKQPLLQYIEHDFYI